jgi:hypothetical protein
MSREIRFSVNQLMIEKIADPLTISQNYRNFISIENTSVQGKVVISKKSEYNFAHVRSRDFM